MAVALTLPMTLRNWETFHNIFGQTTSEDRVVSTGNPILLAKNALRNVLENADTLQLNIDAHVINFETTVGRWLHLDHPTTSTIVPLVGTKWPYTRVVTPTDEGSGSLIALLALVVAAIALLQTRIRRRTAHHELVPLFLVSLATLALVLLLVRWGPFGSRFQLIAFLPGLACVAATLSALKGRSLKVIGTLIVVGSLILTPLALFENAGKPLHPGPGFQSFYFPRSGSAKKFVSYIHESRDAQYFRWCAASLKMYDRAISEVHHFHQHEIGYVSDWFGGYIYPLWALLSERAHGTPVRVIPVAVDNPSGRDTRSAAEEPRVALVLSQTWSAERQNAKRLRPLGYRKQSATQTQCEVVGLYVRR